MTGSVFTRNAFGKIFQNIILENFWKIILKKDLGIVRSPPALMRLRTKYTVPGFPFRLLLCIRDRIFESLQF